MATTIDDLTITYVDNGHEVVKELDKAILSKGAWCTIMYRYQNWEEKNQSYGPNRYSIRRYQKRNGEYVMKSKFNISSNDQAQKIIDTLTHWTSEKAS